MGSLQLIASANTNSGTATTVTFTGISQSYTDLIILMSGRNTAGGIEGIAYMTFNTTSNSYSGQFARGAGASVVASSNSGLGGAEFYVPGDNANAGAFSNTFFYIQNYTNSIYPKTTIGQSNSTPTNSINRTTEECTNFQSGATNAITRIDLLSNNSPWRQYCTFYLYGIDWTP